MEPLESTQQSFLDQPGIQESYDPDLKRSFEFADQHVDPELVDYSKIKTSKDTVLLSGDGVFYTLQGEGPTIGFPALFVRLHNCNLKCDWCDAWYTWNPNTEEFWTEAQRVPNEVAVRKIEAAWEGPKNLKKTVVFTGGEPLIYRHQIDQIAFSLNERTEVGAGWRYEVETNGTLMPTPYQLENFQFNCSPKLANSNNREGARIKPKILEQLNYVDTTFKFVCMSEADLDEIQKDFSPHISREKIIIMPQGVTEEEVSAGAKILAEPCKERGLRLLPRLQNICWAGARRGV